jgi:hypothetical protein
MPATDRYETHEPEGPSNAEGGQILVRDALTHEPPPDWADYKSRIEAGWTGILDGLAATLS